MENTRNSDYRKKRYYKMRSNPEQLEEYRAGRREYMKKRRDKDIAFRIAHNLKTYIYKSIKRGRFTDKVSTELGCTYYEYKKYLESQFDDKMSWQNYGEYWEIDHILPLSKGGSFHYKNTQPLTVTENRTKSNG